jgi:hypothetical protein
VVAAGDTSRQPQRDRYDHARDWNTQRGQRYGAIEVAPSTYGFYGK